MPLRNDQRVGEVRRRVPGLAPEACHLGGGEKLSKAAATNLSAAEARKIAERG